MKTYLLAIDQGTTSSRAIVFDTEGHIVRGAQEEFPQLYPAPGWVEHDPEAIWSTVKRTAKQALEAAESQGGKVAAISVGVIEGECYLDLDYPLDVRAEVDMNVVMKTRGRYIEVQGTGEKGTFNRKTHDKLLDLAAKGIRQLHTMQLKAVKKLK